MPVAKGGGLDKGRACGSWETGCYVDTSVVLAFWIFYIFLINFVCCYEFWALL